MTREGSQVFSLIALCLVAALGYLLYQRYDPYVEDVEVGYQGLAKVHPFLAFQRYWEEQGDDVTFERRFSATAVGKKVSTLFMPIECLPDDEASLELVTNFLKRGGVLVTGFASSSPRQEKWSPTVLSLLGLKTVSQSRKECVKIVLKEEDVDQTFSIQVRRSFDWTLARSVRTELKADGKPWWVSKRVFRRGQVHVLKDLSIFENEHIDEEDHAILLDHLIQPLVARGTVLISFSGQTPDLWTILWRHLPVSMLTFVVLLIAVGLSQRQRFGPALEDQDRSSRPSLVKHIQASAHHLPQCSQKKDSSSRRLSSRSISIPSFKTRK